MRTRSLFAAILALVSVLVISNPSDSIAQKYSANSSDCLPYTVCDSGTSCFVSVGTIPTGCSSGQVCSAQKCNAGTLSASVCVTGGGGFLCTTTSVQFVKCTCLTYAGTSSANCLIGGTCTPPSCSGAGVSGTPTFQIFVCS